MAGNIRGGGNSINPINTTNSIQTAQNLLVKGYIAATGAINTFSNLTVTGNIQATGSVGIGGIIPSSKLHVYGKSLIQTPGPDGSGCLEIHGVNTGSQNYNLITAGHGTSTFFTVDGYGNVGTNNNLSISGTISATGSISTIGDILSTSSQYFGFNAGGPGIRITNASNQIYFQPALSQTTNSVAPLVIGPYFNGSGYMVINNGNLSINGTLTQNASDIRLKTDIKNIDNSLEKVCSLNGINYTYNNLAKSYGLNDTETQVGLIAQEVETVLPEVVKLAPFDAEPDGKTSRSGDNYKTIQYERIIPLLVEAIKELKSEIEVLKNK